MIEGQEVRAAPPPAPESRVRSVLQGAGYTADAVRVALSDSVDPVVLERRLEQAPPLLATLIKLFVLEHAVAPDHAVFDDLEAAGLVREDGGSVRATLRLVPHDQLLIASDSLYATVPDHVAAVHRPSATLANLTVRRPVATALDVGTGNGIQALLCAAHCGRVVATDINERALAFAEFNAVLNGIDNVEFRAGSFFEPAHGERFDLVVCNPPYVISPETTAVFRDSGLPGDTVSERLVAELPRHLADGAFGTMLISWIAGDDPEERPRSWLDGTGCDALLLHTGREDPLEAAVAWNEAAGTDLDALRERIAAWLEYYARLGIEHIGYGALVVRRRAGATWFRGAVLPPKRLEPASVQLERIFAADTGRALDAPVALVETALVERSTKLAGGAMTLTTASVRLEDATGIGANLDRVSLALVDLLDGSAPLRPRLPSVAAQLRVPENELVAFAERLVGYLLEYGFAVSVRDERR